MFSSDDDSDDIQEEDDDDSYSDDFEDYSDDFEEDDDTGSGLDTRAHRPTGTPQMRSDREAMMRNLRRMNSSQEDIPPGSALEETVSSKVGRRSSAEPPVSIDATPSGNIRRCPNAATPLTGPQHQAGSAARAVPGGTGQRLH